MIRRKRFYYLIATGLISPFSHVKSATALFDQPHSLISLPVASSRRIKLTRHSYQLNPDRIKDEVVTNVLVKAMTQFPSAQFSLALHLINPSVAATGELHEALTKLRALNSQLEGAQYTQFWANVDGDDLCADLVADISGFEDMIRHRIALLVSHAFREINVSHLESWLGLSEDATKKFVMDVCGWDVDGDGSIKIPSNPDNEAQKAEIREDVNVDQFARVIRRSWETIA